MLKELTGDDFAPHLRQFFRISAEATEAFNAKLIAVDPLGSRRPDESLGRPFSIVFESADRVAAPQGTYRIEHATMGAFEIFLVPIGVGEGGTLFEAVFT